MAYLLRHNPSGMEVTSEGFVDFEELLKRLRDRWSGLDREDVVKVVERDPKGRYEIKEDKIRARYGHSIDVDPTLSCAQVSDLYHGTTSTAADKILDEGLKSKGRQKVHLSTTIDEAVKVGKRRTDNPVILKVNVEEAREEGLRIERASDRVYVAENIPARFISVEETAF